MGRSRYTITEIDKPHFLTCTIVEWLPLFTRPAWSISCLTRGAFNKRIKVCSSMGMSF